MMDLGLKGKIALVTGGSRGVGRDTAISLANEGAKVIVHYNRNEELAKEVVEEINHYGGAACAIGADLSESEKCTELVRKSISKWGSLDILINGAGIWPQSYVKEMKLEEWEKTIGTNLTSVFLTSQSFVNHCLDNQKKGKILNITSQAAFHGSTTGHAHYASSKAGLVGFSISLAREVAKDGINVNNLALGIVETDMIRDSLESNRDYYVNRIPIGRVAEPSEIADMATFLVSEKANYLTGATLDATGGMLMR